MQEKNKTLTLSFEEAITLLSELETPLISLANIGRHYHHETTPLNEQANIEYALETTRLIDEYNITNTLAQMRKMISEKFDNSIGTDDMGDIERAIQNLKTWEKPGDQLKYCFSIRKIKSAKTQYNRAQCRASGTAQPGLHPIWGFDEEIGIGASRL